MSTYLQRSGEYLPTRALPILRARHGHIGKPIRSVKGQNGRVGAVHASAEGYVGIGVSVVSVEYESVGLHGHVLDEQGVRLLLLRNCAATTTAAAAPVLRRSCRRGGGGGSR
jgi:hypothetical protein